MKNKIRKAVLVISIILMPIVLMLGCTKLLILNKDYYHSQFEKLGVYDNLGHPAANLALDNIFDYFNDDSELNPDIFNEREIAHMKDVKDLMFRGTLFFYTIANLFVLTFVFFYFYRKNYMSKALIYGSSLTLILIITLFLFNFGSLFTGFHEIFFEEGTWTFPGDSMLKTLFPDKFFENFFFTTALYSVIISLVLLVGLNYKKKRIKEK